MKLRNKHIFILGATRFDRTDQSTSYTTANLLAEDNQVYYLDYPYTLKDYFRDKGSKEFATRKPHFSLGTTGIVESKKSFHVVILPLLLSINFIPEGKVYRWLLRFNENLIRRRIRKLLKTFKIEEFIYINSFNFHYPGVADTLNPALTIYHCVDPLIIDYDKKHGIVSENELTTKSDLVICTSKQLFRERRHFNSNTYFIPNAAFISHSAKAMDIHLPVHPLLRTLKGPIIGYIGAVERRMDFELLKTVISNSADKTFVFIGSVSTEHAPEWLFSSANVKLLGPIPYAELPQMLKGLDLTIIPFKKDEVSSTIFPLKLFEYLGSGKPVVSTNFNPDLDEFTQGSVIYCATAEEFIFALDDALRHDDPDKKAFRLAIAKENTWEKRINEISSVAASALNKKLSYS